MYHKTVDLLFRYVLYIPASLCVHDATIITPHKSYEASEYAVLSIPMSCVLRTMCIRTRTEEVISASLGFSWRSGQIFNDILY